MRKPNLFIPGFPKCGTSSLHSMLAEHPDIKEDKTKEPHTYAWDNRYQNRKKYFRKNYKDVECKYILESSTIYLTSRYAIDRILEDSPKAKFIILARDPIDRIVSHLNWMNSLGLVEKQYLKELMDQENSRFNYKNHYGGRYKAYLDFSKYGEKMKYLNEIVPNNDQVLFLVFENVFCDWLNTRKKVEQFLDIDLSQINVQKKNKTVFNNVATSKKKIGYVHRLLSRLQYEWKILRGYPRGLKVKEPIFDKIERSDIEDYVFGQIYDDLKILTDLGYDIEEWPTMKRFKLSQ